MPLTDIACRRTEARPKRYVRWDSLGLGLRITPSGGKYWLWRYRLNGKQQELALGAYPKVTLLQARAERDRLRAVLDAGGDPAAWRQDQSSAAELARAATFEAVALEWIEEFKTKRTAKYASQVEARLRADLFPQLGRRPIAELRSPDLLRALRLVEKRGVLETVRRLKQYCSMIFCFAIASGRAEFDITVPLKGQLRPPKRGHYAAIASKQLPAFLRDLADPAKEVGLQTRLAIRLMMLTFVRTGELIGARWEEFDRGGGVWTIPAARMKMRREHIVPLSRQALAVLDALQTIRTNDYVFGSRVNRARHISNNTILQALERMGWGGVMTGHGFRAMATTILREELKYPKDYIDLQLAHAEEDEVWGAYNRAQFLPERVEMMQAYGGYIERAEQLANSRSADAISSPVRQAIAGSPRAASLRLLN